MVMWNLAGFIGGSEWIIVVVIAVVLIFGAKKIPELAKTFGKARGEFERGKLEGEKELKDYKEKED
ncbi:MAG: translocase [Nitrosopumilus sp. B06]|nr:MAG: translocase [Nitrosopumilus sp. B06]